LFYASPSALAVFLSIASVIVTIYKAVKWFIDFFYIREILKINELMYIIWPKYREWRDNLYRSISEFSDALGLGVDGLIHLVQYGQAGLNILGGLLGKDETWMAGKGVDNMLHVLGYLSKASKLISTDPSYVFDIAYRIPSNITLRETRAWWRDTWSFIEKVSDTALDSIKKVNDIIGDLQELENKLPAFIRDNIPQSIFDSIDWLDDKIDYTLLPALTRIDGTFSEINFVLDAHRSTAIKLIEQLKNPGDILLGVDNFFGSRKELEEDKIDDVASRKYERDTDKYEVEDAGIIAEFERIADALEVPVPPPAFLSIEDMPPGEVPGIVLEDRETWFIGDY